MQMMSRTLVWLLRAYQVAISPLLGNCCRFYPSCSAYWIEAVERHGCARGVWLGVKRVLKCHPLSLGGVDLVPDPVEVGRRRV